MVLAVRWDTNDQTIVRNMSIVTIKACNKTLATSRAYKTGENTTDETNMKTFMNRLE